MSSHPIDYDALYKQAIGTSVPAPPKPSDGTDAQAIDYEALYKQALSGSAAQEQGPTLSAALPEPKVKPIGPPPQPHSALRASENFPGVFNPGDELPEDDDGDVAGFWDTADERRMAEEYNRALDAWKNGQHPETPTGSGVAAATHALPPRQPLAKTLGMQLSSFPPASGKPAPPSDVPQILAEEPPHPPALISTKRIPADQVMPPTDDRSDVRRFLETPIVTSKDIDEAFPFLIGPFAVHKGILKGVAGMTSPEGAAIIAGTGGAGAVAETVAPVAARVAQAGLSAYFATEAGKSLLRKSPEMAQRWKSGDWQGVLETGGEQLVDAALGAAAAVHAVSATGKGLATVVNELRRMPAEGDTTSAKARFYEEAYRRKRERAYAAAQQPSTRGEQPEVEVLPSERQQAAGKPAPEPQTVNVGEPLRIGGPEPIDYDALAKQAGGSPVGPPPTMTGGSPEEPAHGITGFQTVQGSTYAVNGDSTTRTKTPHVGHDPKDVGEKPPSTRTVYVDPKFASEVGMWNTLSSTRKRIVLGENGKVTLISSSDPSTNKQGRDPIVNDNSYSTTPAVGLAPLELFDESKKGHYSGNHPGNVITSVTGEPSKSAAKPPEGGAQPTAAVLAPAAASPIDYEALAKQAGGSLAGPPESAALQESPATTAGIPEASAAITDGTPAPAGTEPWQMNGAQYAHQRVEEARQEGQQKLGLLEAKLENAKLKKLPAKEIKALQQQYDGAKQDVERNARIAGERAPEKHRKLVGEAVIAGKPVPESVLAEHPVDEADQLPRDRDASYGREGQEPFAYPREYYDHLDERQIRGNPIQWLDLHDRVRERLSAEVPNLSTEDLWAKLRDFEARKIHGGVLSILRDEINRREGLSPNEHGVYLSREDRDDEDADGGATETKPETLEIRTKDRNVYATVQVLKTATGWIAATSYAGGTASGSEPLGTQHVWPTREAAIAAKVRQLQKTFGDVRGRHDDGKPNPKIAQVQKWLGEQAAKYGSVTPAVGPTTEPASGPITIGDRFRIPNSAAARKSGTAGRIFRVQSGPEGRMRNYVLEPETPEPDNANVRPFSVQGDYLVRPDQYERLAADTPLQAPAGDSTSAPDDQEVLRSNLGLGDEVAWTDEGKARNGIVISVTDGVAFVSGAQLGESAHVPVNELTVTKALPGERRSPEQVRQHQAKRNAEFYADLETVEIDPAEYERVKESLSDADTGRAKQINKMDFERTVGSSTLGEESRKRNAIYARLEREGLLAPAKPAMFLSPEWKILLDPRPETVIPIIERFRKAWAHSKIVEVPRTEKEYDALKRKAETTKVGQKRLEKARLTYENAKRWEYINRRHASHWAAEYERITGKAYESETPAPVGLREEKKAAKTAAVTDRPAGEVTNGEPWQLTLAEFRKRADALNVPAGSALAIDPDQETAESLQRFSKKDLQVLAKVMGAAQSGTKAEIAQRILRTGETRKALANETVESLEAKPGKDLRPYLDELDLWKGGNKHAQAVQIINWRDKARHNAKQLVAEGNWLNQVRRAVAKGEQIPDEVVQDVKARGVEWILEPEKAEPEESAAPASSGPKALTREEQIAANERRMAEIQAQIAATKAGEDLEKPSQTVDDFSIGDIVRFQGKEYEVGFVSGGLLTLQDPITHERGRNDKASPTEVELVRKFRRDEPAAENPAPAGPTKQEEPTAPAVETHASYKVVMKDGGNWISSGQRWATPEEAKNAGSELSSRWIGMGEWKVEPSTDPVNYRWDNEQYRGVMIEKPAAGAAAESTPEPDDLAALADISPEDIVNAATEALGKQLGTNPPAATSAPKPPAPKRVGPPRGPAPKAKQPKKEAPAKTSANPLDAAADAAEAKLRERIEARRNKPAFSREPGGAPQPKIDKQDLIDLATIGAKHMLDGAASYTAWAAKVNEHVGDLVQFVAEQAGISADAVLRQIYQFASATARHYGVEAEALPPAGKAPTAASKTGAEGLIQAVYEKLTSGESLGNVTALNQLAEKHFGSSRTSGEWTPKDAFDAMEAGINKVLLDRGKALLEMPYELAMKELRGLMERITSQGIRTDEQIKNQQFSTPPTEAFTAAKLAALRPGDVMVEPSAGNGGLAVWAKAIGAEVHVNEISDRRRQMLEAVGFDTPTAYDGEIINALLDPAIVPTVIVMNPPFSAGTVKSNEARNNNIYGFNHVDSALQRLAPGGRLVAILGGGRADDTNGGASLTTGPSGKWFERIARQYNVRANVRIHGREYQKYGTTFATRLIVIDKDGPTASQTTPNSVKTWDSVIQGNVDTLEEAYNLLRNVAASRPTAEVRPGPPGSRGAGNGQSATGLGTGTSDAAAGDRGVSRSGDASGAPDELADRPDQSGGSVGDNRPGAGDQQPALRQPDAQPAGDSGTPTSPVVGSHPANADEQRSLEQPPALELGRNTGEQAPEQEDSAAYVTYRPTLRGPAHPGDIVETKTMATVPMPEISYRPSLPPSVLENGRLSAVQLEAISIAGQQNSIVLPGGFRASALIGDGTGVGKGRISAGILWDNYRQGRKRLVWVSEKWDLMQDAMRDLKGIGAAELMRGITEQDGKFIQGADAAVKPFKKFNNGVLIKHDGVLFSTYALIRSEDKKGNRRVAQLEQYLRGEDDGEGAYILFDESHNLKNAVAAQGGQVSQIGSAVKELLERIPKLRTVSLSATAATDVVNLGYLDRLGLWGAGTPFPNGFREFQTQVAPGGMAAMELIARELKAQGKYVSRTLSFKGVSYDEAEHAVTPEQKELYRTAARAWSSVLRNAGGTIASTTNGGGRQLARFMSQFYGTQQRFFNLLISTLKIPTAMELANKALADGKSVVITLVNTNEAAQNREKNKARELDDSDDPIDYDFGPKEMLVELVRQHYPVQQYRDDVDSAGNPVKVPVYRTDKEGREIPVNNPAAEAARDALIADINRDLHMPQNPLDVLLQSLGGEKNVAELTGRKERYDEAVGKFVPRGDPTAKRDEVNLFEMRAFQSGKKRVAILSAAAGTGISLHAGKDVKNQQKRYHITLQVGWSADKQMQMFGRTHRTNQAHPPEYVMLVSDLGGERRFVSTIARRLGSLGALTKGQKNATSGSDLMEKVNFETDQGRQATNSFYAGMLRDQPVPGTELTGMQILHDLHVLKMQGGSLTVPPEDRQNVTRLLNRLLALDPDVQNGAYNYFYDIFQAAVLDAIERGTLDTGVRTLPGDEFTVKEARAIAKDPKTAAETFYYPVEAKVRNNRVSPEDLDKRLRDHRQDSAVILRHESGKLFLAVRAQPIVRADGTMLPAAYLSSPAKGNWEKSAENELGKYKKVGIWAKATLEKAQEEVERAASEVEYDRDTLERVTQEDRERPVNAAKQQLSQAEERLKELQNPPGSDIVIYNGQKYRQLYMGSSYGRHANNRVRIQNLSTGRDFQVDARSVRKPERPSDVPAAIAQVQAEIESAKAAVAAAEETQHSFVLPDDHYARQRLAKNEALLAEKQAAAAEAQSIASDPQAWAREEWGKQYEAAPSHTTVDHHLVGGAVMRYWNPIKEATFVRNSIFTAADSNTGQRVVGIDIPGPRIAQLLARIGGGGSTVNEEQLYADVLRNNLTYTLEGNIQVRRGRVGREQVIQLIPPTPDIARNLQSMGIIAERGITPVYYVPNNSTGDPASRTYAILRRLLKEYPVKPEEAGTGEAQPDTPAFSRGIRLTAEMLRRAGETRSSSSQREHNVEELGGRGIWVDKGKVIDLGNGIHAHKAAELHPDVRPGDAIIAMLKSGAVRGRGESVELYDTALKSANFLPAVQHAVEEARRQRADQISLDVHAADGGHTRVDVPLSEVGDLLSHPQRYVRQYGRPDAPAFARAIPGFYSQLERTIEQKMPARAIPAQIRATVENLQNGVKADEVKWSGLDTWLAEQKGPITKQAVLDYLKQNEVRVEEVVRGEEDTKRQAEIEQELSETHRDLKRLIDQEDAARERGEDTSGLTDQMNAIHDRRYDLQKERDGMIATPTKHGQWVLPGGQNYRELLLKFPPKTSPLVTWADPEVEPSPHGEVRTWEASDGAIIREDPKRGYIIYGTLVQNAAQPTLAKAMAFYQEKKSEAEMQFANRREAAGNYTSSHWDEPNVLAHVRFDDRTGSNGEKILHVAEIQSDWHQEGRKKGYREPNGPPPMDPLAFVEKYARREAHDGQYVYVANEAAERDLGLDAGEPIADSAPTHNGALANARQWARENAARGNHLGVPAAPFAKTWHELAFRRMLRYAAENGYDKLTWDTGETSAERYDLSKQIDSIKYAPSGANLFHVEAIKGDEVVADKTGTPDEIAEFVGKEIAGKIVQGAGKDVGEDSDYRRLSGVDLKVGGEGMKGFYDKILPAYAAKYGKKWGAKVDKVKMDVTPSGHDITIDQDGSGQWQVFDSREDYDAPPIAEFETEERAKEYARSLGYGVEAWGIDITPAMRKSVMAGQPLFQRGNYGNAGEAVQAEYRQGKGPRPAVVFANAAGMARLAGVWNEAGVIHGAHLTPSQAAKAIAKLADEAPTLSAAIAQSAKENGSVLIAGTGQPLSRILIAIRHEGFHRTQDELSRSKVSDHLGPYTQDLLNHPLAQAPSEALLTNGYKPEEIAAEIGSHLAAAQFQDLGLSREQAAELWVFYVTLLDKQYGQGTIDEAIATLAPMMKGALRAAGRPVTRGRQADLLPGAGPAGRPGGGESPQGPDRGSPESGGSTEAGGGDVQGEGPEYSRVGKFLRDESRSSRVGQLVGRAFNYALQNKQPQAPAVNYSGFGAKKDKFVRNLSQLEKASPGVHAAAVQAATSRAQTAALVRAAVPQIVRALENGAAASKKPPVSWLDFRRALIEGRLRGIRDRWQRMAEGAIESTDEDLDDAFGAWLAPVLKAIHEVSIGEPLQSPALTAAALLERQDFDGLRVFLSDTFLRARDRVAIMMPDGEFTATTSNPGFASGLKAYKKLVEEAVAQNHAENEGVFSDALGPLETYYPLIRLEEDDAQRKIQGGSGRAIPYRKPKNIANMFATGLGEAYDPSMEAFNDRIRNAFRVNNKAALIEALQSAGLLQKLGKGQEEPDSITYRGIEYAAVKIEIQKDRDLITPTGIVHVGQTSAIIPAWLEDELRPILDKRHLDLSRSDSLIGKITRFTLAGPLDAVIHSSNLIGTLVANTPFLGKSLAAKAAGNLPFSKRIAATLHLINTNPTNEEAAEDIIDMAKLGLVPEKYGAVASAWFKKSRTFAEQTGAELEHGFGPFLYGPRGIDIRARLLMYRTAKAINPGATPKELYLFVNQLGNYTRALQGKVERSLKESGWSPFYTAGSTMVRNGVNSWTGRGPMPEGGKGGRAQRALAAITGGAIGLLALWLLAHKAYTGQWPWEDPHAKFLAIRLNPKHRASHLAQQLWGPPSNGDAYVDLGFFSPLVKRGARALGIAGMFDAHQGGASADQMMDAAVAGAIDAAVQPVMGPPAKAAWVGVTGTEPYLTGLRDDRGKPMPQFIGAVEKQKPGAAGWAKQHLLSPLLTMNSFLANVGAATGLTSGVIAHADDPANHWLRMVVDLATPQLFSHATDTLAHAEFMARQRAALQGMDRSDVKNQISSAIRDKNVGKARELVQKALRDGSITAKDVQEAVKRAAVPKDIGQFKALPVSAQLDILEVVNDEEKHRFLPVIARKLRLEFRHLPASDQKVIVEKLRDLHITAADMQAASPQ